jgi:hypothetical protein
LDERLKDVSSGGMSTPPAPMLRKTFAWTFTSAPTLSAIGPIGPSQLTFAVAMVNDWVKSMGGSVTSWLPLMLSMPMLMSRWVTRPRRRLTLGVAIVAAASEDPPAIAKWTGPCLLLCQCGEWAGSER